MKYQLMDDPIRSSVRVRTEPAEYKVFRMISIVLFSLGVSLGMVLLGGSVYADFESMLSNISVNAEKNIRPVSCPVALAHQEDGNISVTINNSSGIPLDGLVQVQVRKGSISYLHGEKQRFTLAPFDRQQFNWEISGGENFSGILLVNVISLDGNIATHKGSCGIYLFDIPFGLAGRQAGIVWFGFSVLAMLFGLYLLWQDARGDNGRRLEAARSFSVLMIIVIVGLSFSALGFWVMAAVFFYIALLMSAVIVPHFSVAR